MAERAKIGELIRIISNGYSIANIGDIFEVVNSGVNGVWINVSDYGEYFIHKTDYVIHRKAGEEDAEIIGRLAVPDGSPALRPLKETQADRIRNAGKELTELLVRKNHDYGDSFAKQYEKYGLMSALIRMDDKMRRLETLLDGTDAQVDESIKDTLLDLAGYALLASVEAGKR